MKGTPATPRDAGHGQVVGVDHLMNVGALVLGQRPLKPHLLPRIQEPGQRPAQAATAPAWRGDGPVIFAARRHPQSSRERLGAMRVHGRETQAGQRRAWARLVRRPQQVDQPRMG